MNLPHDELVSCLRRWLEPHLVVVDVGARWGIAERWLPFGPNVKMVGFDPDEEECARLERLEGGSGQVAFVAAALGPRPGRAELHVTAEPACSSLYAPLPELARRRPELACTALTGTAEVAVTTLDRWLEDSEHDHVDVVKLDTQGSELGALEGGSRALATALMLEVEVEFNEIYRSQPLFGDVDRFLRNRGFVLWRLHHLVHYGLDDVDASEVALNDTQYFDSRPVTVAGQGGQLFWGHAYFVPADLAFPGDSTLPWRRAVRGACAASAFGFDDLARSLLGRAKGDVPEEAAARLRLWADRVRGRT